MLIYLTLVFRVIGSWTLFSQIEMSYDMKNMQLNEHVQVVAEVSSLNKLGRNFLTVYCLLYGQLIIIRGFWVSYLLNESSKSEPNYFKWLIVEAAVLLFIY